MLIVSVEVAATPGTGSPVDPAGYENEQTGPRVTSGVIELQYKVTPPVGLTYPFSGFTLITAWPPLPAGTLLGATALWIVMVNSSVTASTVRSIGANDTVPEASVPVSVMLYPIVGVVPVVLIVAVAPPDDVIDAGLTRHVGSSAGGIETEAVTVHPSVTLPVYPLGVTTVMFEEDVPPAAVASGEKAVAVKVKSTEADAAGTTSRLASRHNTGRPPRLVHKFHLDSTNSDFNMSRVRFKYLR